MTKKKSFLCKENELLFLFIYYSIFLQMYEQIYEYWNIIDESHRSLGRIFLLSTANNNDNKIIY